MCRQMASLHQRTYDRLLQYCATTAVDLHRENHSLDSFNMSQSRVCRTPPGQTNFEHFSLAHNEKKHPLLKSEPLSSTIFSDFIRTPAQMTEDFTANPH